MSSSKAPGPTLLLTFVWSMPHATCHLSHALPSLGPNDLAFYVLCPDSKVLPANFAPQLTRVEVPCRSKNLHGLSTLTWIKWYVVSLNVDVVWKSMWFADFIECLAGAQSIIFYKTINIMLWVFISARVKIPVKISHQSLKVLPNYLFDCLIYLILHLGVLTIHRQD